MNRIKCRNCGLVNSGSDENCRRCEINLHAPVNTPPKYTSTTRVTTDEPAKRSPLAVTVIIILIISIGGYAYFSLKLDIDQAEVKDKERVRQESKKRESEEKLLNKSASEEKYKKLDDCVRESSDAAKCK